MLNIYIQSIIIYLIIYWALSKVLKKIIKNRKDINFNDYTKGLNGKGAYYIFCFVPVLRVLIIGLILFVSFASKETLEKLFIENKKGE